MSALTVFNQKIEALRDVDQIAAIRCDKNCVVTAGAGSGKTMVLSYRFVRLIVEQKCHVDEILTLTFTRLAAKEMYSRIQEELYALADDEEVTKELKLFTKATITTIDAFCHRIVAADPTRYGLPFDFTLDEELSKEMAKECAHTLFKEHASHPGLKLLATFTSPEILSDSLLVPIATGHFHPSSPFDAQRMAQLVGGEFLDYYQACLGSLYGSVEQLLKIDYHTPTFQANLAVLQDLLRRREQLSASTDFKGVYKFFTTLALTKLGGKGENREEYNAEVDTFREAVGRVEVAAWSLQEIESLDAVYAFLELYNQHYLSLKRRSGVVNHGDVAHMARDILIKNKTIREYWQKRFRYILVDEFQDTNRLQKDLVYLLAQREGSTTQGVPTAQELEKDKLFFVGDEKQSIYRFRDADVRVFKRLGREIIASGGETLLLKHNYRSEPALVELFNLLFKEVMAGALEDYEAQFESLLTRNATEGVVPRVEFFFKELEEDTDRQDLGENIEAEAYAIGALLRKMTQSDEYLIASREGQRRPRYEEIAILLRTGSNQLYYERALRAAGIPYTLSAVHSLFLEAPTNDLYSMLQLIVFPDDKLAYLAVLRSPFGYLSDETTLSLLDQWKGDPFKTEPLEPLELAKFNACKRVFVQLKELAATASIASLISYLWYEGGYRNHLLRDSRYQVYLEHFDYLFNLAVTYDQRGQGLSEFLDFLRPRLGDKEKLDDIEPLKALEQGVKILTIHKSKGLEFPIVIVANMGTVPGNRGKPNWHTVETAEELIVVPNHMHPVGKGKHKNVLLERDWQALKAMESAEMKRLFYVALTRAESHLCLFGCETKMNMRAESWKENFLALFLNSLEALQGKPVVKIYPIEDISKEQLRTSIKTQKLEERVAEMGQKYLKVKPNRVARQSSFSVTELAKDEMGQLEGLELPALEADSVIEKYNLAPLFGSWVHALIQAAATKMGDAPFLTVSDGERLRPKELMRYRLAQANLQLLRDSALLLANNFLSSALASTLLADNPLSIESEVAFTYRGEGGEIINGIVDLLVRYKDAIKVIDFKTDALFNREAHSGQLALYRQAMERLYNLPTSSAVVYLRDIKMTEWVN